MDTHRPQSCPTPETSSARVGAGNGETPIENPTDAFRDISERIAQLKAYASYYLAAKMDSIKLSARNAAIYAALGVVGLIAGGTIIAMAAALVVLGIAHGLGSLFGHGWLGDLITGIVILGIIAAGVVFGLRAVTNSSRKRTVEKYEQWQHEQRQEFGTDVEQAARNRK